jgi:RND family efflux transporter MFP subunit
MAPNPELRSALESLRLDRGQEGSPTANRRRRRLWWLVLLPILGGGFVVFGGGAAVTTTPAEETTLTAGGPVPVLNASGYVVARRQATVSSKITGRVSEVLVEEGMRVEQGQVLARLDDAEARRALALAQAQLDAARKAVREVEVRLAQARLEAGRSEKLVADGVASQSSLDAARAEADSLAARLILVRQEAEVAERALAVQSQQLENTIIRAPFAGVAISKDAQPGEMISPISAGSGFTRTGISTIVDMASLEIEVDVNENYINRVRAGQRVEARLNAYPDWKIPASVITTVPAADRQSATVRVRIGFSEDALDPRVLPEIGVKVAFLADPAQAGDAAKRVAVPLAALRGDDKEEAVFVVRDGKASRRVVAVAERQADRVVLSSGVAAGDPVIIDGPKSLKDGQRVRVRKP